MGDDEDVPEISAPPVIVAETHRMFRLTPMFDDLLKSSRQIALVPADSEEEARRIATLADPLGRDWKNPKAFAADSMETPESHVVGDVIFRSMPSVPNRKPVNGKTKNAKI
jgi:hypothetical protein